MSELTPSIAAEMGLSAAHTNMTRAQLVAVLLCLGVTDPSLLGRIALEAFEARLALINSGTFGPAAGSAEQAAAAAVRRLGFESTVARKRDSLDLRDVGITALMDVLRDVFGAGRRAALAEAEPV
jgi:hypothetical protein